MEISEREYLISKIISDKVRVKVDGADYYIVKVDSFNRYLSNEIYRTVYNDALEQGVFTSKEALEYLIKKKLWSDSDEDQLGKLVKLQDDMKVKLYEKYDEDNAKFSLRQGIQKNRDEINRLEGLKSSFEYMTCESIALSSKMRYLVGCSIQLRSGEMYWSSDDDWNTPDEVTDRIMEVLASERLGESEYRELCRTDPWMNFWTCKQHVQGLFGGSSVQLSDEQKNLILWSGMYDSIRQHPECPDDKIMEDDDALDGWLIIQKKKRRADEIKSRLDQVGEKIRESDEVFLPVKNAEEARELMESLNSGVGQRIIKQRMDYVEHHGEVPEQLMPDTIQKNRMEMARIQSERIKGG
jgi:hypothetical protein